MINEFQDVFAELKNNSLLVVSAVMIPLLLLVVYWGDFSVLINEVLYNESVTHIILVPVLVFYLVYQKRDVIKATFALDNLRQRSHNSFLTELVGLSLCIFSFLLYWYGSYTFSPLEYHLLSLPLFLMGIILILFNVKTLTVLIFPILFLFFLIPAPSEVTYTAGAILGNFNTQAAYLLLKTFGLPAVLDSTYGSPTIAINTASDTQMLFAVDLPCSGIYSLIAFMMFASFLAYITQGSLIKKAGIFLVGFVVMQLLNVIRIFTIVAVGYWFGEEIAMSIVHTVAGWLLIFGGILIILLVAEKLLRLQLFQSRSETQSCSKCSTNLKKQQSFCTNCGLFLDNLITRTKISRIFLIKLLVLFVGLSLVASSMQAPVFAFSQGLTFMDPNLSEKNNVFPDIEGYKFTFLYRDVEYEKLANQDASLIYAYIPLNSSTPTVYVDVGIANSLINLHNWEVCYVTAQTAHGRSPVVSVIDSRDVQIVQNPPIVARYFVFESPNGYTQVTLYWYETAMFNTGLTIEKKFVRISLIILAENSTLYNLHEEILLNFALPISEYWEPLKTQSLFSLSVSLQQILLVASTIFIFTTGTTQYARKLRKKQDNQGLFEKLGPPAEKLLYDTLKNINEGTGATIQEIACALEQATGKPTEMDELTRMLTHLQENGLADVDLLNMADKSRLIWKA